MIDYLHVRIYSDFYAESVKRYDLRVCSIYGDRYSHYVINYLHGGVVYDRFEIN
jgi:hypothetical protein